MFTDPYVVEGFFPHQTVIDGLLIHDIKPLPLLHLRVMIEMVDPAIMMINIGLHQLVLIGQVVAVLVHLVHNLILNVLQVVEVIEKDDKIPVAQTITWAHDGETDKTLRILIDNSCIITSN